MMKRGATENYIANFWYAVHFCPLRLEHSERNGFYYERLFIKYSNKYYYIVGNLLVGYHFNSKAYQTIKKKPLV